MPLAKLRPSGVSDAIKSEGNDSIDTFIRQAIGKEPPLSVSRTGESPVQWIQLFHALDQQDLPGWPLLTHLKVQMQKCDKCTREFCSPINYRRHTRVHRRSLNFNKEPYTNRTLLGAFWDKLTIDEAKEVVSFKDVNLEEVPGSSITRSLTSFIHKPGFCVFPHVYVRAGSALLDIIQGRSSSFPVSSQELFGVLDDASEGTFLCAGATESMQKYVFDGEAGKIGLEMKNVVACTSFLIEQQLVKAWIADKDAEALRCQKLLVEEEEAAHRRQAAASERKRQKKLRQKEQKAKEQMDEGRDELQVTVDTSGSTPSEEPSSPPSLESNLNIQNMPSDDILALFQPGQFTNTKDDDTAAQRGWDEHVDSVNNVDDKQLIVPESNHRHTIIAEWKVAKTHRGVRNGFRSSQNLQVMKLDSVQKHGPAKDPRGAAGVNGCKIWTKKCRKEKDGEVPNNRVHDTTNQSDENNCEVMIGSICVPVKNDSAQRQDDDMDESQDNLFAEQSNKKNTTHERPIKADVQFGANRSAIKLWRPVSMHEARVQLPVQNAWQESDNVKLDEVDDRMMNGQNCQQSHDTDRNDCDVDTLCPISEEIVERENLFSTQAAKAFLTQRWKEAISGDHVRLVLSQENESLRHPCSTSECDLEAPGLDSPERSNHCSAENQPSPIKPCEFSTTGNTKAKLRPEKIVKIKYIPKQKALT